MNCSWFYQIEAFSVQAKLNCLQLDWLLANRSHDDQLLLEARRLIDPIAFIGSLEKLLRLVNQSLTEETKHKDHDNRQLQHDSVEEVVLVMRFRENLEARNEK
jgi:hypothetical protein